MYECVWVFQCVCIWECVSEVYVFRYASPSGKTHLCIYSISILSVSFAYNMQTATWWSDRGTPEGRGRGGKHMCMGGIEPEQHLHFPTVSGKTMFKRKGHWGEVLWHFSFIVMLFQYLKLFATMPHLGFTMSGPNKAYHFYTVHTSTMKLGRSFCTACPCNTISIDCVQQLRQKVSFQRSC